MTPKNKQVENPTPLVTNFSEIQKQWQSIIENSKYSNCNYFSAMQTAWNSNPYLQNTRLKKLSSYPYLHDRTSIEEALKDPRSNEQALREASWAFNYQVTPIMKIANLYPDILLYNHYIQPVNVTKKDIKSLKFKKEYAFCHDYMRKLNPKRKFRNITLQTIREGKAFVYLREGINKKTGEIDYVDLQFLPSDWVKVTYRTPQTGYGCSFNMIYFHQAGTSVDQFAPEFKGYLDEMYGAYDKQSGKFNFEKIPNDVVLESFSNSNQDFGLGWAYWKELDPRKCFVISFDDTDPSVVPVFASSFLGASDLSAYRILQQELLSLPLSQVLTGEVPLADENKSGSYGNDTKISPELILMFQNIFDTMATGLPIRAFFSPMQNMELHKLDAPDRGDIVGDALQNFYSESALSGIITTEKKPSIAQIKVAQITETQFIKKIYDQFEDMMNRIFENKGMKYTFTVKMIGDAFSVKDDKEFMFKGITAGSQKELIVPFLALNNMSLLDADCLCDLVDSFEIYSKFEPTPSTFTNSGSSNPSSKNGRPEVEDSDSDGTATSKANGSNTAEGREVE